MENAGVEKQQTAGTSSIAGPVWDPFWFMRAMLMWWRPTDAPLFDVKETDDTCVCTAKVKLALPDQADATQVTAELNDGALTLLVPKAAPLAPEPASSSKARRRTASDRRGSGKRKPRRR